MTAKTKLKHKKVNLSEAAAARIAREHYGIDVSAVLVDGYADLSFLLHKGTSPRYVLKITAPDNEAAVTLQNSMLAHLSQYPLPLNIPQVVVDKEGRALAHATDDQGVRYGIRLLTYLHGEFACDVPAANPALLRSVGRGLGALTRALQDFSHPLAERTHSWHLLKANEVCAGAPVDKEFAGMLAEVLGEAEENVAPCLNELRKSVIHGDANDHNVLVVEQPGRGLLAGGLIDFGDAAQAPTIFEVAIALAYFMMRQPRPVLAAQELLAAFHKELPLTETEIELLYDLVRLRLCMTLSHAARARSSSPDNEYLLRSEDDAKSLLRALKAIPRLFFTGSLRDACRLPPLQGGQKLTAWIARQSPRALLPTLSEERPRVLDFTPRSEDLGGVVAPRNLQEFESLVERLLGDAGTAIGIGRYGEIRGLYQSKVFVTDDAGEARTVHLGVDVFAPAGTAIAAPLSGRVHSFADNAKPLDYGPTIILQHDLPGAPQPFYTLYGHLARRSLEGLAVGQEIAAGSIFAYIGEHDVNGGWPPHLHFQVMTDMLGKRDDFPGVARHSEINVWKSLCPNPARFVGLADQALDADCGMSPIELARRRDLCLSPSLSLAFDAPVKVVRGRGSHLFTEQGRKILDLVNNVAHVGHTHPHVVAAVARQEAALNTNTRYLHDGLVSYAERLTALLPASLDTCFLVCTGSEANELALRLARAYTGARDVVVVDGAYHGHTANLIELSPYKFDGRGGAGRAAHVQVAAMPDTYNGEFSRPSAGPPVGDAARFSGRQSESQSATDPAAGQKYAQSVADAFARVEEASRAGAAFFCESPMGCGGQIILPEGYLSAAFAHARAAGAVCVADEVQVGFGRLGGRMWAFEAQGAVPDILTLGKPIGNGYPLAAVITRRDIAEAFANGMEYFNTFGGNPVACAAGNAVLDVIESEGLLAHAERLGADWLVSLRSLMTRHEIIGDVRGQGLFIGIELVRDRGTREAHPAAARAIIEALKKRDIQMSIDGPRYNVLKIKPPMVITRPETERVTRALDEAFDEFARKSF